MKWFGIGKSSKKEASAEGTECVELFLIKSDYDFQ